MAFNGERRVGVSENGAGGCVDDAADAIFFGGLKEADKCGKVGCVGMFWRLDAVRDRDDGGFMKYDVDVFDGVFDVVLIADIAMNKFEI